MFLRQFYALLNLIFTDNQLQVFDIDDGTKGKKSTKFDQSHLIQFIILMHRCAVKTLREKVFLVEIYFHQVYV